MLAESKSRSKSRHSAKSKSTSKSKGTSRSRGGERSSSSTTKDTISKLAGTGGEVLSSAQRKQFVQSVCRLLPTVFVVDNNGSPPAALPNFKDVQAGAAPALSVDSLIELAKRTPALPLLTAGEAKSQRPKIRSAQLLQSSQQDASPMALSSSSSTSMSMSSSPNADAPQHSWLSFDDAVTLLGQNDERLRAVSLELLAVSEPDFRQLCSTLAGNSNCWLVRMGPVDWHEEIQARTAAWLPQRLSQNVSLLGFVQTPSATELVSSLRTLLDSNVHLLLAGQGMQMHVSLCNRQLPDVPASLYLCGSRLSTLDLSQNCLRSVPAPLLQLSGLVALDLSDNALTALPSDVHQLSALRALDVSCNRLTALPAELAQLSQLVVLDVHSNRLRSLLDAALLELSARRRTNICLHDNPFAELADVPDELRAASGSALITYVRRINRESRLNLATRVLFLSVTPFRLFSSTASLAGLFADKRNLCPRQFRESFADAPPSPSSHCRVKRTSWNVAFTEQTDGKYSQGLDYELWDLTAAAANNGSNVVDDDKLRQAAYPFYLSSRSIAVVVFSLASRSDTGLVNQFVQNLRNFGGSKVILLGADDHRQKKKLKSAQKRDIIEHYRAQFPVAVVPVVQLFDPSDAESVVALKERIVALSLTQKHLGEQLPPSLDGLAARLAAAAAGSAPLLPYSAFVSHCKKSAVSSSIAAEMASLLAGLGLVLWSSKMNVLVVDPHWLVELFVRLLRSGAGSYGKLDHQSLASVWPASLCPPDLIASVLSFFAEYGLCLTPDVELLGIKAPPPAASTTAPRSESASSLQPGELYSYRFSLVPTLFLDDIAADTSSSLRSLVTQPADDSQTLCRIWALRYLPGPTFLAHMMVQILLSNYYIPAFWKAGLVVRDASEPSEIAIIAVDRNRARITLLTRARRHSRLFRVVEDHMSRSLDCLHRQRPREPYPVANVWVQCPHCLDSPTLFMAPTHFSFADLLQRCLAGDTHALCTNPMLPAGAAAVPVPFARCVPDLTLEDLRPRQLHLERSALCFDVTLGRGGFGIVQRGYRVDDVQHSRPLAIKTLSTDEDDNNGSNNADVVSSLVAKVTAFHREIDAQAALRHPAIVALVGFNTTAPLTMVQECADGGDFYHLAQRWKAELLQPTLVHSLQIAYEIACAVEYMHALTPAMIHRDIKAPNVLLLTTELFGEPLLQAPIAKLADFGLATCFPVVGDANAVENPAWLAPECIEFGNYSKASDVFGLAVFMWENMFLRPPYHDVPYRFSSELGALIVRGERPRVPERVPSRRYVALMKRMWHADPAMRPSAASVRAELGRILRKYRSGRYPHLTFPDPMEQFIADDAAASDDSSPVSDEPTSDSSSNNTSALMDDLLDDFGGNWDQHDFDSASTRDHSSSADHSSSSRSESASASRRQQQQQQMQQQQGQLRHFFMMKNQHAQRGPAAAVRSSASRSRSRSRSRSKSARSKPLRDDASLQQQPFFESFLASQHAGQQQATWAPVAAALAPKKQAFIADLLHTTAEKTGVVDPRQRQDFELFFNVVGTQNALDALAGSHWLAFEANDVDFEDEAEDIKVARTDFEAFYSSMAKPEPSPLSQSAAAASSSPASSRPAPPAKKKSLFGLKKKGAKDDKPKLSKRKQLRDQAGLGMTDLEAFLQS